MTAHCWFPPTQLLDEEFDEPDGMLVGLVQHGDVLHVDTVPSTGRGETDADTVAKWINHYTPEYWAEVRARALQDDPLPPLPAPDEDIPARVPKPPPPPQPLSPQRLALLPRTPPPLPPPDLGPIEVNDLVSWEGRTWRVIGPHPVPGAVQVCSDDGRAHLVLMSHMLTKQGPMWISTCAAKDAACATEDAA